MILLFMCCCGGGRQVPTESHEAFTGGIQPYVQDVMDGIEYATADASTYWGGLRAKVSESVQ